jgi:hypothetical protein
MWTATYEISGVPVHVESGTADNSNDLFLVAWFYEMASSPIVLKYRIFEVFRG